MRSNCLLSGFSLGVAYLFSERNGKMTKRKPPISKL